MWRYHRQKLSVCLLILLAVLGLAFHQGELKAWGLRDSVDSLGEAVTLAVCGAWLSLIISSRPVGRITNYLFFGSFLLLFSATLDLADEVLEYPPELRLFSRLESFPAPVGMVLLTIGLFGWHREQQVISRQLQGREGFLRDHQLIDPLTQLYGPVYLHAVLNREIKLRRPGQPLSLLLLDIAGFTAYNRQFGVAAGDELLQRLAIWFAGQLRPQDVICRYSGDCFVVLLPETPRSSAELLAQHLQSQLQHICTEPLALATVVQQVQQDNAATALQQLEQALHQMKVQPSVLARVWY